MPDIRSIKSDVQRRLVQRLDKPTDPTIVHRRQGVIVSYNSGTKTAVVAIGGNTASPISEVHHLAWYTPSPGDTVWIDFKENDALIIGNIAT